uniref:Biotin synthase family protein n=1 Tax=Rhizophora mucronata TaxID=61149 RepID=A0A2P2MVT2_RHIMU
MQAVRKFCLFAYLLPEYLGFRVMFGSEL